nr:GrpB family protein [Paenibacillus sp. GP183]
MGACHVPHELDNKPWRRFFVKVKDDKRVAHLHLIRAGEERWEKQLLFRDRLRGNPHLLDEYKNLKLKLAQEFMHDREAYTEAKSAFIKRVLEQ